MHISKFHYITNYQSKISHLQQVQEVIKGGASWIQYRPKEADRDVILREGREIADYCKQHSVTFIMNDMVDIAFMLHADGVHLGKNDMSPTQARQILGDNKIIGGTANTANDVIALVAQGVNYVGLGPYTYTKTKKNLSPVLALKGFKKVIETLSENTLSVPLIAIGGIKEYDVCPLLKTGVYGIAVSSLLSEASDISLKTKEISNLLSMTGIII